MKEILHYELTNGRNRVPSNGTFLHALFAPNGKLYGYWLCEDDSELTSIRYFELVNVADQRTVPDGYTYLCAVPSNKWSNDNYLLFIRD